jgi:formate/nitrite transporter FocA (FNT family)
MTWLRAALGSLMGGAFLGFAYAAMTAVLHPEQMPERVWHVVPLRLDTFGAACFAISFVTQCALGISRPPATPESEGE